MDEVVKTVAWSAPLSAVITSALIWLLRSWISERLTSSIRHEYNKDLEAHKAVLKAQFDAELEVRKSALKAQSDVELELHKATAQQQFHIFKSQFDMEFSAFQRLWTAESDLVDATARLANSFIRYGFRDQKIELEGYAKVADEAFFSSQQVIRESRPFMPAEIHATANALAVQCKEEIDAFFGLLGGGFEKEDFALQIAVMETEAARKSITEAYINVAADIRTRLLELSAGKKASVHPATP